MAPTQRQHDYLPTGYPPLRDNPSVAAGLRRNPTIDSSSPGAQPLRLWRTFATSRPLQIAMLAVFLAAWGAHAIVTYNSAALGGLFRWIGIDFGFYLAQAEVFAHGNLAGLYSIDAAAPYREALAAYATTPGITMPAGPVPYPPLFAWMISPLLAVPAPLAFAIWTMVNAAATLVLAWRASSFFPQERRLLAATLVLVPTAVVLSLWYGQIQIFLALAFGEAFIAFRRSRDLTAGLCLAVVIVKPQYLLLILLILLWKGRWNALAGFAIGVLAILLASVMVAGVASIGAYVATLVESATTSSGTIFTAVAPDVMVNWRALALAIPLDLPAAARLAITVILSGLTVLAVLIAWRGSWHPSGPRFASQMTLLGIGTILIAYHSHIHGVAMIVVPLAAFLASGPGRETVDRAIGVAIRLVVGFAIVAPWFWFVVLNRSHTVANAMVAVALVIGFFLLFVLLRRNEDAPVAAALAPSADRAALG
jgi:hypothetical protein